MSSDNKFRANFNVYFWNTWGLGNPNLLLNKSIFGTTFLKACYREHHFKKLAPKISFEGRFGYLKDFKNIPIANSYVSKKIFSKYFVWAELDGHCERFSICGSCSRVGLSARHVGYDPIWCFTINFVRPCALVSSGMCRSCQTAQLTFFKRPLWSTLCDNSKWEEKKSDLENYWP